MDLKGWKFTEIVMECFVHVFFLFFLREKGPITFIRNTWALKKLRRPQDVQTYGSSGPTEWVVPREPQVETSSLLGPSLESHFCLLRQITKASPNQGKGTYLLTHLFFIEMKSQILVSVVQYNDLIRCIYCKMITLSLVNSHYHIVTIFFFLW